MSDASRQTNAYRNFIIGVVVRSAFATAGLALAFHLKSDWLYIATVAYWTAGGLSSQIDLLNTKVEDLQSSVNKIFLRVHGH